jgi:hypothetical protein
VSCSGFPAAQARSIAAVSAVVVTMALVTGCGVLRPASDRTPRTRTYRAPVITLAHPAPGGSVRAATPIVVFRFAAGETSDPIDLSTLRVSVDGTDRTRAFQVSAGEAWGPIITSDPTTVTPTTPGSTSAHTVAAHVCSGRGVCASTTATVAIAKEPSAAPLPPTP